MVNSQKPFFLINGFPASTISVMDRGLTYGDGVFETILWSKGRFVLLEEHLSRLYLGCEKLGIPYKKLDSLPDRLDKILQVNDSSLRRLIKVTITRGSGGRGYSPSGCHSVNELIGCFPPPEISAYSYREGIAVRLLSTPTITHPMLSGIKHLNRLEQVLAAKELSSDEFEGIMQDQNGCLVEGTKSNIVFRLKSQKDWCTPSLRDSGIKGVLRQHLLKKQVKYGVKIIEKDIYQQEIDNIQSLAVFNSVFGIIPIKQFNEIKLDVESVLNEIQAPIHSALPF